MRYARYENLSTLENSLKNYPNFVGWSFLLSGYLISYENIVFSGQHQNGSVLDGLTVWKNNVDKRFEGVEECYICFYVLHGANHQLPKLACKTCKKKFHSACLFKWFSTSNNSTCPLCRNLFSLWAVQLWSWQTFIMWFLITFEGMEIKL